MSDHTSRLKNENNNRAYKIEYYNHIRAITQICWYCPMNLGENSSSRKKRKPLKSWKYAKKSAKQWTKCKEKSNYILCVTGKPGIH